MESRKRKRVRGVGNNKPGDKENKQDRGCERKYSVNDGKRLRPDDNRALPNELKELTPVPVPHPRLIPRHLLEQIKDRDWEVDDWYEHNSYSKENGDFSNNIVAWMNPDGRIMGFVWFILCGMTNKISINSVSFEKEVQGKGCLKLVFDFMKDVTKKTGINDFVVLAKRGKAIKRYGLKTSDYILMEGKINI